MIFNSLIQLLKETSIKIDKKELVNFDSYFILPLSLMGIIFSLISIVVNIFLGFNFYLNLAPIIGILIFITVYYLSQKVKYIEFSKWLFILTVIAITNLVWYYNFGSKSVWYFMFILLYSYLIFMMSGRQLLLITIILIIDVSALFLYEYNLPEALGDYPTEISRIVDNYIAILLFGITVFILMSLVKRIFLSEYKKAKEADLLKSSFLSNLTHEIRTPLNSIMGFSAILSDPDSEYSKEEKKQFGAIIADGNNSLLRLMDDILDASLLKSGQMKIESKEFCVNELMDDIKKVYSKVIVKDNKKSIHFTAELPSSHTHIISDKTRINQVITNLLDNAFKFTNSGSIKMGFTYEDELLHFYVSDTGIGIEEKYAQSIFTRFFKIESDNSVLYRGSGIGLYLTKKNVELLGGNIWFESEFGNGTTFHVTIPAVSLPFEEAKIETQATTFNAVKTSTLLIVEDDPDSLSLLNHILKGAALHLLNATTGKEALELFKENINIGMVLTDIQLPDIHGFDVAKKIKEMNPNTIVIAQTAYDISKNRQSYLDAGFDDFIEKPIFSDVLLEKIDRLTKKKE